MKGSSNSEPSVQAPQSSTAPKTASVRSLEDTLADAWRLIEIGVSDRKSAYHLPTVATVLADGTPSLRTVVLRGADTGCRTLRFHTDRRTEKYGELAVNPRIAMHLYDPLISTQIRLTGRASLHVGDQTAQESWDASAPMSRLCYATETAPGSRVAAPPAAPRIGDVEPDAGYADFCAVVVTVESLEWLFLAATGHQRARFEWDAEGEADACWIAP